jgi:hypothetical protein
MQPSQIRLLILVAVAFLLLSGSRTIAGLVIEYQWWQELRQLQTWYSMLAYQVLPAAVGSLLAWLMLLWAHSRGVQMTNAPEAKARLYSRLVALGLLVMAVAFIGSSIDSHTVMAYVGSQSIQLPADAWNDPVFGHGLPFYLFDLPFYSLLLRFVLTTAIFSILIFWITGRGWQIFERLSLFRAGGGRVEEFDPGPNPLLLPGATRTSFARTLGAIALFALAAYFFLGRFGLLMNSHAFMTGMDWLDENVSLPLRWVVIAAALAAIPLLALSRLKLAGAVLAAALLANGAIPAIVQAVYVRPNELDLERPYIQRHIETTTEAYGLRARAREQEFGGTQSETIDIDAHGTLIDNIRLWDWRAFKDTITQIQALRPYYEFADIDVDRYMIDGKIKQVLLSPREIDVAKLPPEARQSWINPHFVYTHGYGVVMSEVNRTTDDDLPVLLIQDAPPEIRIPDIQLERPEIYYGEMTHDPVFVATGQREFDYPSGEENVTSHYQGEGGFPIGSIAMRLAASVRQGEYNILLTGLTNETSRMMIYRNVRQRLAHLASFIHWDPDPYMVVDDEGRLMWIVDGYTTSNAHPYSAAVNVPGMGGALNYVRNSVKATIDAYHGTTTIYVFDPSDPILQAYRSLFPDLFHDEADMPPRLRRHARYPELMFAVQAEIYRTFHMKDPDVFYNKEDVWDVARSLSGDTGTAAPMHPTYIVATIPGESQPEFLLMLPFTPRGKDNLLGWMAARCDGEKLGELIFFQLSKQQLVFGPNQIESRINQDQQIARDLSLWNQQGSRVLRGEMLALPVGESFLYVESIYIQAETARMPQLRKVVLAMGNRLIYEDTFEQALSQLSVEPVRRARPDRDTVTQAGEGFPSTPPGAPPAAAPDARLRSIETSLQQLRRQAQQLVAEIEKVEQELQQ